MSAAATAGGAAKSFMSMSNEYWLIGIIIVLVTVILMLIVYVVKIKQSAKPAIDPGAAALSPALPPLRIAESDDAAVDTEQIARIAHQQFVPRSARRGVSIEPIPSNSSGSGSAGDDNTPRAQQELIEIYGSADASSDARPEGSAEFSGAATIAPASADTQPESTDPRPHAEEIAPQIAAARGRRRVRTQQTS